MASHVHDLPSKFLSAPSHLRLVIRWKSWGVKGISLLAIWKVWVVSYHLSSKDCTKMALADLLGSKLLIGLKLTVQM